MSVLQTPELELVPEIMEPWLGKIQSGSAIATLSPQQPMTFGAGQAMIFDTGEAEYVGEGQNHGSTTVKPRTQKSAPYKFHKTIRYSREVLTANDAAQTTVVAQMLAQMQPSLSRALDYGIIHGIDPSSGLPVPAMVSTLKSASSRVEYVASNAQYASTDAAKSLVLAAGYVPSGFALDPALASGFATARTKQTEQPLYPDFRVGTEKSRLEAMDASVSKTVGAVGVAQQPSKLLGIVGDFGGVRWGIQQTIGLELIQYGDPDGQGDLKRKDEIAIRAEVIYGWGINEINAFALIVDEVEG